MSSQNADMTNLAHEITNIHKLDWYLSKTITADYTITDIDKIKIIYVTTSTNTITVILPTAADNKYRVIEVMKIDSAFDKTGAGSMITVDGEGAETINGQTTIDIEVQYCGLRLKCDGVGWYVLDTIGDCKLGTISGTIELVYWKYLLGTTAISSVTDVAHGVDLDKIFNANGYIYNGTDNRYLVSDVYSAVNIAKDFLFAYDATNLRFLGVGAQSQDEDYKIYFEYYV